MVCIVIPHGVYPNHKHNALREIITYIHRAGISLILFSIESLPII